MTIATTAERRIGTHTQWGAAVNDYRCQMSLPLNDVSSADARSGTPLPLVLNDLSAGISARVRSGCHIPEKALRD